MTTRRPAEFRQPADSRIQVTTNRRGTEILFPAARNPGAATGVTVFLAIWTGFIWLMLYLGAPRGFPIVFGLFALTLVHSALELWFRVTRVRLDAGVIAVGTGYLALARERRFQVTQIVDVAAMIGMQAGGTNCYHVVLVRSDGKRTTAGHAVRDRREAEWLADTVKQALDAGAAKVAATGPVAPGSRRR